jgi:outer membrane lipoprotein-sorting protein
MKNAKNMKTITGIILSIAIIALCVHNIPAEELTARQIVKNADDLLRGDTSDGTYEMTVKRPNWERTLKLRAYGKGRDRTFIRILKPPKEAGITTLRIENNMWNYLPNVERVIKIPPSMMLQSWMGSDFSNDDLVKESSVVNDYTHEITAQEDTRLGEAYKIELTPKPEAAVTWGKIIFYIRKEDFVPIIEEFYDEHGKIIKVLEYYDVKRMSDRRIPATWVMTKKTKENHVTIIKVLDVKYNEPIPDSVFTMSNLRSGI